MTGEPIPNLKEILAALGVNVPVLATRVVGGRLELYLYGGGIAVWPLPAATLASPGEPEAPGAKRAQKSRPRRQASRRGAPAAAGGLMKPPAEGPARPGGGHG